MSIQEALAKTINLPLTKTTRSEVVQYFHFGKTHYTTPQGLILDVGAVTLAINCPWQLLLPNGESIKHNEVFMRRREAGMPVIKFDWKVPGANLRDQRLMELINAGSPLTPQRFEPTENNGFILYFDYGVQLIVAPDTTKEQDVYWQVFSNTGDGYSFSTGSDNI
ncbi:hypothetical protein H8S95_07490 [Pontibacter sp. KCTC 32443]|uniref:hypothetical protein n=1 Tax=Pontibacter TaxID=323449 RepID=UPI00164E7EBD|nr:MULTISPECIES: hypothetical protein [Pontibacter]MBC5773902.1 hypothetical protein [Pontibacter sp. KCTC 32443]